MNAPEFISYVCIKGILVTKSPLHVGNGESEPLENWLENPHEFKSEKLKKSEVSTVTRNYRNQPYVPGSTLKGILRSQLPSTIQDEDRSTNFQRLLFGNLPRLTEDSLAGKITICDAHFLEEKNSPTPTTDFWNPTRKTALATSVSIDRTLGTSKDHALFRTEYVPAGMVFSLEVHADNISADELQILLNLLERFNQREASMTIGANQSNGWGVCNWKHNETTSVNRQQLIEWINDDSKRSHEPDSDIDQTKVTIEPVSPVSECWFAEIEIEFTSPWLASSSEYAAFQQKRNLKTTGRNNGKKRAPKSKIVEPAESPLIDGSGKLYLPAESLRGALRAQAEKIARTLGLPHVVGDPGLINPTLREVDKTSDELIHSLSVDAKLFGASGWRSPLSIDRFYTEESFPKEKLIRREFVAIDRFTGSSAESFKYSVEYAPPIKIQGCFRFDLTRLDGESQQTCLALLNLVLLDLAEGDILLGAHGNKGFGRCRIGKHEISYRNETFDHLGDWFRSNAAVEAHKNLISLIPSKKN